MGELFLGQKLESYPSLNDYFMSPVMFKIAFDQSVCPVAIAANYKVLPIRSTRNLKVAQLLTLSRTWTLQPWFLPEDE